MNPNHNHGSYLENINNTISGYAATRDLPIEYQPLSRDYNLVYNDHEIMPQLELNVTKKLYIHNTGNLSGTIIFNIDTNEFEIHSDARPEPIKIKLILNDDLKPIGASVNGIRIQEKKITENERGNLDDSAIQYTTSPDNLQQHI